MSADPLVAKMNDVLNRVFELEKQGKYHEAAEYQAMMLVKVQQEFKAQQVWQPLKQFLQCKLPPLPFNALGCNLCGWQFHIQREPMQHQVARRRQSMSKARMSLRMSVSEVGTRQSRRSVTDWLPSSLDTRLRSLSDAVINAPVGGPAVAPLSVLDKGTQALCALLLDGEATGYEALDPTSLSDAFEIGLLAVVGASCATPLMTIFPPLMLLRCEANKGDPLRPLHAVLCGLGCLMTCAGLVVSIMDFGGADDALPPTSEATWDYSSWIRFRSSSVFAAPSERPV